MTAATAIQTEGQINTQAQPASEFRLLLASRIRRNPGIDPRISRNASKYNSIKESIALHGVQQPILVRPIEGDPDHDYEVTAGNTRHCATLENKIEYIPAMIRSMTDAEARMAAAIENVHRADLTPVEEARHVKVVLADMANDHEAVCLALNWSRTKLTSRILLSHCNDDVAEALVQDKIKIGHAELLAGAAPEAQSFILEKIIERKMTVADARDRLFALARDLTKAKFDKADCQGCPKNSATSRDLFDTSLAGSMCQDATCWDAKSAALIEVKLIEVRQEFGVVHTDLTLPKDAFVALQANGGNGVGDAQYSACTGCASYGAVVSTVIGSEGDVKGGLCFNKECNTTKRAEYKASLIEVNAAPAASASAGSAPAKPASNQPNSRKPAVTAPQASVMRKAMRRKAFNLYSQMGQQAIKACPNIGLAVAITSLYFDLRGDIPSDLLKRIDSEFGIDGHLMKEKRVTLEVDLAKRSVEDLTSLLQRLASCTAFRTDGADEFEKSVSGSQNIAFIEIANLEPKDYFLMSADYLKTLVKAGVIEECKRAGFDTKYNEVKGEKAFAQLAAMKGDDMIKAIMAFTDFDWKGYVPLAIEITSQKSVGTAKTA